jgi:inorganic pyrophosphatase
MTHNELIVTALFEIPKGSRNKYEYDEKLKMLKFDRMLFSPVHYPTDYGFVRDTLAEDGDALDVLVLVWEPTFPGCIIDVKPVGLFKMKDQNKRDDKILAVPISDPHWNHIENLDEVPPHLLREVGHFFSIYKELEEKKTEVEGWEGFDAAIRTIKEAQERFRASH